MVEIAHELLKQHGLETVQVPLFDRNEGMALKREQRAEMIVIQLMEMDEIAPVLWRLLGVVMEQVLLFDRSEEMEL